MPMTARARSVDGSPQQTIDVNGRHTIRTDTPARLGGADRGPSPHELLPAMLASCISTMIGVYARARDWSLSEVEVDIDYDADAEPRDVQVTVNLPEGLTPDQVARLRRVAESCPVKRALEAGFTFEQRIVLRPAASRPEI